MNDQKIIEELRTGNTQVMKELMDHYHMVKSYVVRNSGKEEDAKDLFQDTLFVFIKNLRQKDFVLTAQISTYLFAIAKRIWLKKLRDRRENITLTEDPSEEQIEDDFSLEFLYREPDKKTIRVADLIKKLNEVCRKILDAYYYRKLSFDLIAERLGYQSGQVVRQQKYRCLTRLRAMVMEDKIQSENLSFE